MKRISIIIVTSLLLVACDKPTVDTAKPQQQADTVGKITPPETVTVKREHDITQVVRGAAVFKQNCAECHGANGEGAPNWRQRDANDKFPAPPLNGDGHSWHHPLTALRHTIRNGTLAIGGSMPAWKEKLSDADIDAVITWFQSKWPDQAYVTWQGIDQRARNRNQ